MKTILHSAETRGRAEHGWLQSRHSFSFADYYDPERMGFGALRVINDDIVAPGAGFGTHAHDNMEIISIPLHGSLRHEDSVGHVQVIRQKAAYFAYMRHHAESLLPERWRSNGDHWRLLMRNRSLRAKRRG